MGTTTSSLGSHVNAGGDDLFAWKLSHAGIHEWFFQDGTASDDGAYGVDINGALGDIVISGYTNGDMAGSHGGRDMVFMMLDSSGVAQWTVQIGDSDDEESTAVAWDPYGQIFGQGAECRATRNDDCFCFNFQLMFHGLLWLLIHGFGC